MTLYEKIRNVLEKHKNKPIPRSFLVEELHRRFNTNPSSIFPSDYCYNRINKGSHRGKYLFLSKENHEYEYVGENYSYTGPIYYRKKGTTKDEIVGEWLDGKIISLKEVIGFESEKSDLPVGVETESTVKNTTVSNIGFVRDLKKPTKEFVNECIAKFDIDKRISIPDQALKNLITKFPENKSLEDILLKVTAINALYSTNIYNRFQMAEHILKLKPDNQLTNGDPDLVNMIASGHGIKNKKSNAEIYYYSFATKYCSWHNHEKYALYDDFVRRLLLEYQKHDNFSSFNQSDLKDFPKFLRIIKDFMNFYSLTQYNLKEIDKFLWIYGQVK